ncbi:MAG: hypothetical protein A2939_02000 [Parcubacteria group bacterium RIFCSPLOWO2_01_FULL_48_18]|nr:MAG: hypothetical protein A3J67_04675 [Parcubacteria group bacterium RIFCSPHIGHO2_02_FULL_48_10b]OHB22665.1 MAG: hypothetical protein A2939_02000 [Parcubacteria group bacterium RIFCSPLOWO2_01_FULL_48_18]
MPILYLLEYVGICLVILFMTTQVIWPVLRGRQPFPFFRRQATLESDLSRINQDLAEAELERKIKEREQALRDLRRDSVTDAQGSGEQAEKK